MGGLDREISSFRLALHPLPGWHFSVRFKLTMQMSFGESFARVESLRCADT